MEASYHRHDLNDREWSLLKPHLPGQRGQRGSIAKNKIEFINGVLWLLTDRCPLRRPATRLRQLEKHPTAFLPLAR